MNPFLVVYFLLLVMGVVGTILSMRYISGSSGIGGIMFSIMPVVNVLVIGIWIDLLSNYEFQKILKSGMFWRIESEEIKEWDAEIRHEKKVFKKYLQSLKNRRKRLVENEKRKRKWNKLGITRENMEEFIDHLNSMKLEK